MRSPSMLNWKAFDPVVIDMLLEEPADTSDRSLIGFPIHHRSNVVELKDGLTVAEVVQLLEDNISENTDTEVQNIFIAPPAANELTDKDSGDEDTGEFLNNLPRSQLESEAEAVLHRKWTDGDLVDPIKKDTYFPKDCPDKYKNMTSVEIFELFIDEEVVTVFVTDTKKYALSKNECFFRGEKGFLRYPHPFRL
ncbi:hypothetical protein ILUMI_09814 [Ignelater luminosus]|uniref:Uncharacterized protein n=1 Tax=Ignelater luminosus TaxID=2038154 RepID=A0A8K0D358_IGNLU|nr:hypothetical protein ILUMI_09814 [Ignelater luminosus]